MFERYLLKIREMGLGAFLLHALRVAGRLVYRTDNFWVLRRSTDPIPLPKRKLYRVISATAENIPAFAAFHSHKVPLFLERVRQGNLGFFYLNDEDECHGYNWCAAGSDYFEPYHRWRIKLSPTEAYSFDAYCTPYYRGSMGPLLGISHLCDVLRERGVASVIALSHEANAPAWKFHLHFGFEIVSRLRVTRVLTWPVSAREVDHLSALTPEIRDAMARYEKKRSVAPGT